MLQPPFSGPTRFAWGTPRILEPGLRKRQGPTRGEEGFDFDSLGMVDIGEQERDPFLLLALVARATQQEDPVGVLRVARPGLLSVQDIVVPILVRAELKVGEIRTRIRLGVALTPDLFA